ncbi:small GTPase superfamily [Mycena sanguinolenta]|nr:small GTPase superfamily [Mycena sanguinolenta]
MKSYDPTYFCVENYYRQIMVDGEPSSLSVLDTAGAEQFTPSLNVYIKPGHGFVLVSGLAQQSSLDQVNNLRKQIYWLNDVQVPVVVAATENDHANGREVPAPTLESLSSEWDIPFYETSAKHNLHVNDVFEDLVRQMRRRYSLDAGKK